MQIKSAASILLIVCLSGILIGQQSYGSKLKSVWLKVGDCSVKLDSLTIIPSEIRITDSSGVKFTAFNVINSTIYFKEDSCASILGQNLKFEYRTFTFDLGKTYTGLDTNMLEFKEKALITGYEYRPLQNKNALIESKGLNYKGSFARGISVGNSQSLVLNSNFDLQLYGDLGNGLKVVAAISDENLPIQAQGNTQQLQEFDKVFIQVSKEKTSVIAGDYELRRPNSYFMNYFKKVKGLSVQTQIQSSKNTTVTTSGSFAISRGKFARQELQIREGNQGPYRLRGNNGERFLIVLAGTEKVFFNGILLKRGFDYDYIIDYNRAELTFSPTRVVSRDSRVIVEFEYTDITYLRSLYATNSEFAGKNWKVNLNIYSEQDSKTATGDIQLDSLDISILNNSGDDRTKAVRPGIRNIPLGESVELNRIFYKGIKAESIPDGLILIFTENIDSAQYTAFFTEVDPGTGNYEIDNTRNKNARVYRYVGENMGKYRAVIQLIPPEKKQLVTLNGNYKIGKSTDIFGEIALSNLDLNTRSEIDNNDNTGLASHFALQHSFKLDTAANWRINTSFKHEFVQKDFNALNPFRAPEFVRDWNIAALTNRGDENLILGNIGLSGKSGLNMDYGINHYNRSGIYEGNKHLLNLRFAGERLNVRSTTTYLTSSSEALGERSTFIRPYVNANYKILKNSSWAIGTEWDAESNLRNNLDTDTLIRNSFQFSNIKAYIGNDFQKDFALRLSYSVREDFFADRNTLKKSADARELEFSGKWFSGKNSELSWNIIGRDLKVLEEGLIGNETSRKTVLGKIDYGFQALNGAIRSTTVYNINSGQEPKIEYIFQRVEVGQGDYFLISPSESPNLSNIQDFRYDPTNPLSDFIRLSLFNNEFIRTNNLELNQNLRIEGSKFFKSSDSKRSKKINNIVKKLSTLSSIRLNKKKMDDNSNGFSGYFDFNLTDTSLVAYNALFNNTLFINKGNVKFDMQIGNQNNQNRIVQVSGFEDRSVREYFIRSRWNVRPGFDLLLSGNKGIRTYTSEAFGDRNLDIDYYRINPEVSIRPNQNTRLNVKYVFTDRQQRILSMDQAALHEFSAEYSIRKASKYSLDQSISFVNINYSGAPNSPIEYDLLEGLKNGKNFLWNIIFTKRMSTNVDLTINYEGRKTGVAPVVHIARAQIKATF